MDAACNTADRFDKSISIIALGEAAYQYEALHFTPEITNDKWESVNLVVTLSFAYESIHDYFTALSRI